MEKQIESSLALAIIIACNELINTLDDVKQDSSGGITTNLFSAKLKISLAKTMQSLTKNLNQDDLNKFGSLIFNK